MHQMFLSCDWGTSNFRLRLVDTATSGVIATAQSDEGVAAVFEKWQQEAQATDRISFFQNVIQHHIGALESSSSRSLTGVPIVASGMASSSIGMKELPYGQLPFFVAGGELPYEVIESSQRFGNQIILLSGARTETDVMRGEETQLAGCLEAGQNGTKIYVFPGTHSKHITVVDGYATHLQTYMTGEFFSLLANNSILSNSVAPNSALEEKDNKSAFKDGVLQGCTHNLLHQSFMVRTNSLFNRYAATENYWYLSGLLIGAELVALQHVPPGSITIVGAGAIVLSYQMAFEVLGIQNVSIADVNKALIRAHAMILNKVHPNYNK